MLRTLSRAITLQKKCQNGKWIHYSCMPDPDFKYGDGHEEDNLHHTYKFCTDASVGAHGGNKAYGAILMRRGTLQPILKFGDQMPEEGKNPRLFELIAIVRGELELHNVAKSLKGVLHYSDCEQAVDHINGKNVNGAWLEHPINDDLELARRLMPTSKYVWLWREEPEMRMVDEYAKLIRRSIS